MAEEFVELGFEGLDRFADRYWDRTYDRLPNVPRLGRKRHQLQQGQLPSGYSSQHPDKGCDPARSSFDDAYNREAGSEMYGAGGQDSYAGDTRYYEAERADYADRAPGPGFRVPRDQLEYGRRNTESYAQAGQRGYDRPTPRRRGSSWSPPRSDRRGRSQRRSSSPQNDVKQRLIATIGGALVGGLAGNQVAKGQRYDTAATVAGAIIGGVGAREAADQWEKTRQKKKEHKGERYKGGYRNGEGRRSDKWHDGGRQDDDGRRYT